MMASRTNLILSHPDALLHGRADAHRRLTGRALPGQLDTKSRAANILARHGRTSRAAGCVESRRLVVLRCVGGLHHPRPRLPGRRRPARSSVPDSLLRPRRRSAAPAELARWWERFDDPLLTRLIDEASAGNLDLARPRRGSSRRANRWSRRGPGWCRQVGASAGAGPRLRPRQRPHQLQPRRRRRLGDRPVRPDPARHRGGRRGRRGRLFRPRGAARRDRRRGRDQLCPGAAGAGAARACPRHARHRRRQSPDRPLAGRGGAGLVARFRAGARRARPDRRLDPQYRECLHQRDLPARRADRPGAGRADRRARRGAADPGRARTRSRSAFPADTLRQRPDVRAAERSLAAATARIGVAEAQLYPALRLSGNIGTSAFSLGRPVQRDHRRHLLRARARPCSTAAGCARSCARSRRRPKARSPPTASRC